MLELIGPGYRGRGDGGLSKQLYSVSSMSAGASPVCVVVVTSVVSVGTVGDVVEGDDDGDTVGATDGEGRGLGATLGLGVVDRGLERVVSRSRVVGFSSGQLPRCLFAIHAGAPLAIASSGHVIRYIETSRLVCQRPFRYTTQYGSPECSLAITAQPPPQSMMREPLSG